MTQILLATEDQLSESVGECLIKTFVSKRASIERFCRGGNAPLRAKLGAFCNIAKYKKVLLLTDLDKNACAMELMIEWRSQAKIKQAPDQLMFRVAVREVESWILADDQALRNYLGVRKAQVALDPDALPDPKRELLKMASFGSIGIKRDMLPEKGAIASVGIGYNARMCEFVGKMWDPRRAAGKSDSLRRACERLKQWAEQDSA